MTDTATTTLTDVGGRPVVLTYSSVASEYEALRTRAVIIDQSHRGRMRLTGERAAEMLNGLVTNDVAAMEAGHGCYAAALTPKGKIVADLRIYRDADGLLVDAPARAIEGWASVVKKYVNPRLAPYHDLTATHRAFGIFGPQAHHVAAAVTGGAPTALGVLPLYAHVTAVMGEDGAALVARVPDAGIDGFLVYLPAEQFDAAWARALEAGATPAGVAAWDVARIEAGYPEWGIDIDDTTIPQEANFDDLGAISYTKGCYTGQEVVARVHFRGHVNRHLRGVRCDGTDPVPAGAQLLDDAGKLVGDVRSAVSSPRLGGIGLAMIRREIAPGSTLLARWDGGERPIAVHALPFPR